MITVEKPDTADEWDEAAWLRAAAHNPAFDFLKDPKEDVYTLDDGKPFDDVVLIETLQRIKKTTN